mgnify:CR=1 FL=1
MSVPATEGAVRLLIADDHELYRRGLQTVLSLDQRIEVVGEASDGEEAVRRAVELAPDVVVMDVRMPRLSGIEAAGAIRAQAPSTRILILTMSDEEADLFAAIKAGANGYLLKEVPAEEIADGILSIHAGQSLIPPSMAAQLLTEFAELSRRAESGPADGAPRLTDREVEVLRLVAKGQQNRDIARELFIAENTVKNHVRNILEKLQMHSRTEAAMYAVRERLIDDVG